MDSRLRFALSACTRATSVSLNAWVKRYPEMIPVAESTRKSALSKKCRGEVRRTEATENCFIPVEAHELTSYDG